MVTRAHRFRAGSSTGRLRPCSTSSHSAQRPPEAASRSAASSPPTSRTSTALRSSSTARRRSAPRPAHTRQPRPARGSSTARRRSRTSRSSASSPRRASAPTSRRSASSRSRARRGWTASRILFHGNNKSDDELRAAAEAGATVVLDAPDEPARAAAAGVRRVLVRLTPGVEAVTHQSIQTAHDESKFGLAPDAALAAIAAARDLGLDVAGVHFHVGSQLARVDESLVAVDRLVAFCAARRGRARLAPAGARHRRRSRYQVHARGARARRSRTSCRRSSPGCRTSRSCSSRAARSSAARASPSTASVS